MLGGLVGGEREEWGWRILSMRPDAPPFSDGDPGEERLSVLLLSLRRELLRPMGECEKREWLEVDVSSTFASALSLASREASSWAAMSSPSSS